MSESSETASEKLPKGIPPDHPSIGRQVREPIEGPSWPQARDHGGGRIITPTLEVVWMIALTIWVFYSRLWFICPYFKDPDAARLTFGVAQRLQGISYLEGVFYQLEKQVGTYLVFEWLARLFRVDVAGLEHFLPIVCACFMIGILALSFHLGYMIWGRRVALVSTTLLAISPMMWITGEYTTSLVPALFFFMLAVWAMVLSYRVKGGRWWLAASGLLFAWATLVRLDMLLGILVPICYAHFVDRRGLRRALILYAIWAVVLLLSWMVVFRFPLAEIFHTSQMHQPQYPRSLLLNWWGMGPFLFVFAFSGFVYRFVTDRRPLPFIFFWIVGFNTFYTGHLYSPRYFIPYYPVVGWLAAFSIIALYAWLAGLVRHNRPLRLLLIVLFAFGALTMLTTSIIKDGDRGTRIAWGETITYTRNHGLSPTGAVWFYMQDFQQGKGLQYAWLEDGARRIASELLDPESPEYISTESLPTYVGSESQVFFNYFLLASGWRIDTVTGSLVTFKRTDASADPETPTDRIQTVHVGNEPDTALAFLSEPQQTGVLIGREALARLIFQEDQPDAPKMNDVPGWHVEWSFDGLDILKSGEGGGASDGTLSCEREFARFFGWYPLPRYHVNLSGAGLEHVTELSFECSIQPEQWLALAINRIGLVPPMYKIEVNGELVDDAIYLAQVIEGYRMSKWDIILVPPWYLDREECEFRIESDTRGNVYDIYWVQRNFPDSQYRDEVAVPLGIEFGDIECWR